MVANLSVFVNEAMFFKKDKSNGIPNSSIETYCLTDLDLVLLVDGVDIIYVLSKCKIYNIE